MYRTPMLRKIHSMTRRPCHCTHVQEYRKNIHYLRIVMTVKETMTCVYSSTTSTHNSLGATGMITADARLDRQNLSFGSL